MSYYKDSRSRHHSHWDQLLKHVGLTVLHSLSLPCSDIMAAAGPPTDQSRMKRMGTAEHPHLRAQSCTTLPSLLSMGLEKPACDISSPESRGRQVCRVGIRYWLQHHKVFYRHQPWKYSNSFKWSQNFNNYFKFQSYSIFQLFKENIGSYLKHTIGGLSGSIRPDDGKAFFSRQLSRSCTPQNDVTVEHGLLVLGSASLLESTQSKTQSMNHHSPRFI